MSRPGITYDEVVTAAQQLTAQGKLPTIETIRLLTGTGSNTTIAQHLKAWKGRQAQAKSLLNDNELPEELAITLKGLWNRVLNQAEEKVIEIRQDFEQTTATHREHIKKLETDNTRWQQQYHLIKQEKEALSSDKSALEQMVKKLTEEKLAATLLNDSMTKQLQEKQERIDELHRLNRQIQSNLEHYHEASREQRMIELQRYEQAQTQSTHTINQLNQELALLNQQKNSLQQELEQIRCTKSFLQDQYDQLAVQHASIKSQLDQAQKDSLQHAQAEHQWQNQYQNTQEKLDEQNKVLTNLQSQLAVLTQKLSDAQNQLKEVSEQNKFLTNERWTLGQENAQLLGQLKQFDKFGLYQLKAEKEIG